MRPALTLKALVSLAFAPSLAMAQAGGPAIGPEFQVNSYTTGTQNGGSVSHSAAGDFVVVWGAASGGAPHGQLFDASGTAIGGEVSLHANTVDFVTSVSVAMNGSGEFVVCWDDGVGQYDAFLRSFDSAGLPDGDEFVAHDSTSGWQQEPAVAIAPDGSFVASWTHFDNPDNHRDIWFRRFDSAGQPIGLEMQVNEFTTGSQRLSRIAIDGSGDFVVVWQGSSDQDGSGHGAFAQRYDAQGTPLGGEFQVNTYTSGDQLGLDVGMKATGEFVVAWSSYGQDGSDYGVFAQRFDAFGAKQGGEFQVNSYTTDSQAGPRVAIADSGEFVIVWHSDQQDGSEVGLFAQQYDMEGNPVEEEFQVNSHTEDRQVGGWLSMAPNGDFVVAWTDWSGQDGDSGGIFAQRFAPMDVVFADDFESGDTSNWSSSVP